MVCLDVVVWDADAAAAFPAKLAQPTQQAQQAQPTRRAQQAQPTRQAQQAQPNIEVKKADGITIIKPNKPIRQLYKKTSIQASTWFNLTHRPANS